jgi:cell wall-associated NlpC family hydrolase
VVPLLGAPGTGAEIATHVRVFLGAGYRTGGTGPAVFDCSGLVQRVYADLGFPLPRSAAAQALIGQTVERDDLALGDLVFFDTRRFRGRHRAGEPTHVGIYVGDGEMVHAPGPGDEVTAAKIESDYFAARYLTARRIVAP